MGEGAGGGGEAYAKVVLVADPQKLLLLLFLPCSHSRSTYTRCKNNIRKSASSRNWGHFRLVFDKFCLKRLE